MGRKEREREARKKAMVEAAKTLFLSKGYHKTSLDEIAKLAEFSKPTLYSYFKNKAELYLSVYMSFHEENHDIYEEAMTKGDNGYERFKAVALTRFDIFYNTPGIFDLDRIWKDIYIQLKNESSAVLELFSKKSKRFVNRFYEVLEMGKNDGSFASDLNIENAATYYFSTNNGLIETAVGFSERREYDEAKETYKFLLDFLLKSFT